MADMDLDGLPVRHTCPDSREELETIVSRFLDAHRRFHFPSIDGYAETWPHLADEIRRLFPVLIRLEQTKQRDHGRILSSQLPNRLPLQQVSHYRLGRLIRRTATTFIHQSRCPSTGKPVRVTVLGWRARNVPRLNLQFCHEAALGTRLHHENIVPVRDHGTWDGYSWFATPDQHGLPLSELLSSGVSFSCQEGIEMGHRICDALVHTHQQGTLHNNICPDNIYVGEHLATRLAGFALEQRTGAFNSALDTTEADPFAAPERIRGNADERSDVYSLGMTLCHAVGIDPRKRSQSPGWSLSGIFSAADASTKARLADVLRIAIQPNPAKRFDSIRTLRTALQIRNSGFNRRSD